MLHTDIVRRILVLYHIQGYAIKDIMGITHLPRQTINDIVYLRTKRAKRVMETGLDHKPITSPRTEEEMAAAYPSIRDVQQKTQTNA